MTSNHDAGGCCAYENSYRSWVVDFAGVHYSESASSSARRYKQNGLEREANARAANMPQDVEQPQPMVVAKSLMQLGGLNYHGTCYLVHALYGCFSILFGLYYGRSFDWTVRSRSRAVGIERLTFSKKLYKNLEKLEVERRLDEIAKDGNLLKLFTGRPKLVSTVVDATGLILSKADQAIGDSFGEKAICVELLAKGSDVLKVVPDSWLEQLPILLDRDYTGHQLPASNYVQQKMLPLQNPRSSYKRWSNGCSGKPGLHDPSCADFCVHATLDGKTSSCTILPERGSWQGCKLVPILQRVLLEDVVLCLHIGFGSLESVAWLVGRS
eukprot:6465419-Amphidinium_carterae.4